MMRCVRRTAGAAPATGGCGSHGRHAVPKTKGELASSEIGSVGVIGTATTVTATGAGGAGATGRATGGIGDGLKEELPLHKQERRRGAHNGGTRIHNCAAEMWTSVADFLRIFLWTSAASKSLQTQCAQRPRGLPQERRFTHRSGAFGQKGLASLRPSPSLPPRSCRHHAGKDISGRSDPDGWSSAAA